MSQPQLSHLMLFRSFLTIGSGYMLSIISLYMITALLGYTCFPEFVEFLELDQPSQETVMANNPAAAVPRLMFVLILILQTIVCLAIGALVIRTAPFAQFPHAVFLACLLYTSPSPRDRG